MSHFKRCVGASYDLRRTSRPGVETRGSLLYYVRSRITIGSTLSFLDGFMLTLRTFGFQMQGETRT